jgi:hypothetical protein
MQPACARRGNGLDGRSARRARRVRVGVGSVAELRSGAVIVGDPVQDYAGAGVQSGQQMD